MFGITLSRMPLPARLLFTAFLLNIAVGYAYALGHVAMVVGWTPAQIARHYYGNGQKERVAVVAPGEAKEEELDLFDEEPAAPAAATTPPPAAAFDRHAHPPPSFKSLVGEGHFHLFGMAAFFFGVACIALFLDVRDGIKCVLVTLPFISIIVDNVSFMATRFFGPGFSFLTALAGALMGLSFAFIFLYALYDMWILPRARRAAAAR